MRLQSSNLHRTRSCSEQNLIDLKCEKVLIEDSIVKPLRSVSKICDDRQSSTSEVSTCSSFTSSSVVSASRSSVGYGSLKETPTASFASGSRLLTPTKQVARFGRSTWSSILIASEEALIQWEEASKRRRKTINEVLDDVSFVSPMSFLESETLLTPNIKKLPLRRYCSDIDLRKSRNDWKCKRKYQKRRASLLDFDDTISFEDNFETSKDIDESGDSLFDQEEQQLEPNLIPMKPIASKTKKSHPGHDSYFSARKKARSLISTIKLDNPISVAVQLTNIDKQLFLQLKASEVFLTVYGREKALIHSNRIGIESLIAFREEVKRMVMSVVTRESNCEYQSRKIAAFVEVACVLRKLRNWNSLDCVIKALQSPHIYILEKAWFHTKNEYAVHFGDYLKLTKFVKSCDQHLIRTSESQPSIPSLKSFLNAFKIQCSAKYDLCLNKRRWTESETIIDWIEQELRGSPLQHRQRTHRPQVVIASLHPNRFSLLPYNDAIRFIAVDSLPFSWIQTDLRSISSANVRQIYRFFRSSFVAEMNYINSYKLSKTTNSN